MPPFPIVLLVFLFSFQNLLFAQQINNYSIEVNPTSGVSSLQVFAGNNQVVESTSITGTAKVTKDFYVSPNETVNVLLTSDEISIVQAYYQVFNIGGYLRTTQYDSRATTFYFPNPCPEASSPCSLSIETENISQLTNASLIRDDTDSNSCTLNNGTNACDVITSDSLKIVISDADQSSDILINVLYNGSPSTTWKQNNFGTNVYATTVQLTMPDPNSQNYFAGEFLPVKIVFQPSSVQKFSINYVCAGVDNSASDVSSNQDNPYELALPSDCYGRNPFDVHKGIDLVISTSASVYQLQSFTSPTDAQEFDQGQIFTIQLSNTIMPGVVVTIIQTCGSLPDKTYLGPVETAFQSDIPEYFVGTCIFNAPIAYYYAAAGPLSVFIQATQPPVRLSFVFCPPNIAVGIPFVIKIVNILDSSFTSVADVDLQCGDFGTISTFYSVPVGTAAELTLPSIQQSAPLRCVLAVAEVYFTGSISVTVVQPLTPSEQKAVAYNLSLNAGSISRA